MSYEALDAIFHRRVHEMLEKRNFADAAMLKENSLGQVASKALGDASPALL